MKLETNNEGAEQGAPSLCLSPGKTPCVIYYLPLRKAGRELRSVAQSLSSHRQGYLLNSPFEGLFGAAKHPDRIYLETGVLDEFRY